MFLTVTLNPALDKTLFVERNAPNVTVRATRAVDLAGGKGVNVARALRALGGRARAFMPLGGHPGNHLADLARAEGIEVAGVPIAGQTRTALTIQDAATGDYWHYLEPGPELDHQELTRIREGFLWAMEFCQTVILSGSLPCPAAAPLVAWMVSAARERGMRVALDSFAPTTLPALEAGPWMAKPNLEEAEVVLGESLDTGTKRWAALSRIAAYGVKLVVLSLGEEGALALAGTDRYRILPPPVQQVNDLGGGDSMVAGICWAARMGYSVRDCLLWGAACGAANAAVWDPGGIRREDVERLIPQVTLRAEF